MSQLAAQQAQKLKSLLTPVSASSEQKTGSKRKMEQSLNDSPSGSPPIKVCFYYVFSVFSCF
jgi:hypothetical protein